MEGGCYPRGGSQKLAEELVPVIESFGGKVLIRALVDNIVVEGTSMLLTQHEKVFSNLLCAGGKAVGVKMRGGQTIRAKRAVVSSAGYTGSMKLLDSETRNRFGLPATIPGVPQSAGFVMCNIGIKATAEEIGATNTNTWHVSLFQFTAYWSIICWTI
jgi:all-trans-retinol 13,14-reductase